MSINFEQDISPEVAESMREMFDIKAMDQRTALFEKVGMLEQKKFKELANTAGQPVTVQLHQIGDRKEVGGVVYELDEKGWRRLPIGTDLKVTDN